MQIPQNNILDLLISLTLIYALMSILVSLMLEWWNQRKKSRATMLKKSIEQLLNDPFNRDYGYLFYNHQLVSGLRNTLNDGRPPQYISANMFADVLIDVIARQVRERQPLKLVNHEEGQPKTYAPADSAPPQKLEDQYRLALSNMNASPFKDVLQSFHDRVNGDLEKMKPIIEEWYKDYMDRASGWYKNSLRKKYVVFGFLVAVMVNMDSLHLVKVLSLDDNLREKLVNVAEKVSDNYSQLSDDMKTNDSALWVVIRNSVPEQVKQDSSKRKEYIKMVKDSVSQLYMQKADSVLGIAAGLNIPLGWSQNSAPLSWFMGKKAEPVNTHDGLLSYNYHRNNDRGLNILMYLLGIFVSGISLSFGAPFWFDLLNKLVNIRRAGNKPQSSKK